MLGPFLLSIITCLSCLSTDWSYIQKNYDYSKFNYNDITINIRYIIPEQMDTNIITNNQFISLNYTDLNDYIKQNNYEGVIIINLILN
jgi:hypothetical protein